MKKIFLIIATTIIATTAWAQSQQLLSVKGKTKDGKSINVQYYKGTVQDYIESVKYQLVDELKTDIKNKQNSINDLQHQLNKANKQIDKLNDQLKKSNNTNQIAAINDQLNEKQSEIEQLNNQIGTLSSQLNTTMTERDNLKAKLDSIETANFANSQKKGLAAKTPVIGVEASLGGVFLDNSLGTPWEKDFSWNKQMAVYFGTARSDNFPISIEAGVGFRSLPLSAHIHQYTGSLDEQQDIDGHNYRADYEFNEFSEKLTMNCLEVPVRLCFGQPVKDEVTVYAKLGVTPSFVLASNFARGGTYTVKGYYPQWHVCLDEIDELDFHNDMSCDNEAVAVQADSRFDLWGNVAFGAYLPLGSSLLFNAGVKLDYPIMKTGSFTSDDKVLHNIPGWNGLLNCDSKMLIPSLQVGFVYTLR